MIRKLAPVCVAFLAAMACFGCATAELINPTPLAPCDATNDCPLPDSGSDAVSDAPAEATSGDAAGDTGTDTGTTPDASDSGASDAADADAKG